MERLKADSCTIHVTQREGELIHVIELWFDWAKKLWHVEANATPLLMEKPRALSGPMGTINAA
jgi:hypothetical protein